MSRSPSNLLCCSARQAASKLTVVAEEYDGHHRRVMRRRRGATIMWAIMSAERTPGTDLTGCVFKALTPSGSCPIAWVAAPSACALARPGFDATWPSRCSMICLAVTDMMPRWSHPGKHTANSKHHRPENLGCSRRSRCPPSLHPQCGRRCTKIAKKKVTSVLWYTTRRYTE